MSSVKAHSALILAVVFVLGILAGVGGTLVVSPWVHRQQEHHDPRQDRQRFVQHMQKLLDMTPQQTTQFSAILQETTERWDALHRQVEPQFEAIRQQQRDKVRAMLNPQQVQKFNEFVARFDAHRKQEAARRAQQVRK
jgi:hypothetical protein